MDGVFGSIFSFISSGISVVENSLEQQKGSMLESSITGSMEK